MAFTVINSVIYLLTSGMSKSKGSPLSQDVQRATSPTSAISCDSSYRLYLGAGHLPRAQSSFYLRIPDLKLTITISKSPSQHDNSFLNRWKRVETENALTFRALLKLILHTKLPRDLLEVTGPGPRVARAVSPDSVVCDQSDIEQNPLPLHTVQLSI